MHSPNSESPHQCSHDLLEFCYLFYNVRECIRIELTFINLGFLCNSHCGLIARGEIIFIHFDKKLAHSVFPLLIFLKDAFLDVTEPMLLFLDLCYPSTVF